MARIRIFLVLTLAVGLGGTFAYGTYRYIQEMSIRKAAVDTRPVVVAANALDIGDELKADDIRVINWPADSAPATSVGDPSEVTGRGVVAPIAEGELIVPGKLADKGAGAGLPPAIPPGLRALSVRVNEVIGVAGYVLPGTHVDVIVSIKPAGQDDTTSKVILTNVQVLTAGTKIERDDAEGKPIAVTVVTLLVSPAEAERLTLASTEGKIQLALRNPLDKGLPQTQGIKPAPLIGNPGSVRRGPGPVRVVATVPPPIPPLPTVEIIRGDKRVQEIVRN
jgi:pilus assembly protein CpaB